jgi:hypothetical protein
MRSHSGSCFSLALIVLLLFSCDKDKPEKPVYRDFSFNPLSFLDQVPAGLKESDDPYARLVYDDIAFMLDWSEFIGQLTLPDNALKQTEGSNDVYRWNHNTGSQLLLLSLTFSKEDYEFVWKETISYGVGASIDYLTARLQESGKIGTLDYNVNWFCGLDQLTGQCDPVFRHYQWNTEDSSSLTYYVKMENLSGITTETIEYRLSLNSAGYGTSITYIGDAIYYEAYWDSDGSGHCLFYEGSNTNSFEWTVD